MTQDIADAAPVAADPAAEAVRVAPEGQVTMTHPDTEGFGYSTEQAFTEVWEPLGWTRLDGPVADGAPVPAPVEPAPIAPVEPAAPTGRRGSTAPPTSDVAPVSS